MKIQRSSHLNAALAVLLLLAPALPSQGTADGEPGVVARLKQLH